MNLFSKNIIFRVLMIGLIIYILFELILVGIATYNQQNKINELYRKSNTVQAQIEKVFQSTITISDGYLSFMKSNLDATKEDTEQFLNHLLSYEDNYIKNIALIEDTTIKYNYPYEQNQASIGIDLSTIEGQRDDVLFVKNNTVSLFDGPVELVQGGQAFIIRIPIIDGMVYWGQISVVIDADQFIQIIQNSADVNDVNVKITDSLSKEQVLLFGEDLDEDSASTQYENKYFSWDIEVTEANTQSHLVIDLVTRLVGMLVILILCQFLYKSILLNQTILYNGKHDSLTGDYNRAKFIRDYEENRFNGMLIAFTDVNKFKTLNDTLGHLFGDWCLIQLSKSFHQLENIRTYRISGDEFILVSTIPMTIADFKEKIKSNRFVFYNPELKQNIDIDISIGVLENLIESIDLESMLMYLDYAMYDAKKENKEFTVVDQNLMTTYDETKVIEQHLIDDVKKIKLIPYYQPIIDLKTGKISGFEVLSRWLYRGEIRSAAMFISVVKKVKYVELVDRNLFDKLQEEYTELIQDCEELKDMTFSVNLSAESLMLFERSKERFDFFVKNRVIPIDKTIFEISEDMNLGVISIDTLRYIQKSGYTIAVDDFGAGVSKLSDVLSGELPRIKTDKSLLPSKSANDKKITGFYTIIKAIRASGSSICAEGVETVEQMEMAIDAGCKLAQGFLFSRPIPKDQVIDFVKNFDFSNYKK